MSPTRKYKQQPLNKRQASQFLLELQNVSSKLRIRAVIWIWVAHHHGRPPNRTITDHHFRNSPPCTSRRYQPQPKNKSLPSSLSAGARHGTLSHQRPVSASLGILLFSISHSTLLWASLFASLAFCRLLRASLAFITLLCSYTRHSRRHKTSFSVSELPGATPCL